MGQRQLARRRARARRGAQAAATASARRGARRRRRRGVRPPYGAVRGRVAWAMAGRRAARARRVGAACGGVGGAPDALRPLRRQLRGRAAPRRPQRPRRHRLVERLGARGTLPRRRAARIWRHGHVPTREQRRQADALLCRRDQRRREGGRRLFRGRVDLAACRRERADGGTGAPRPLLLLLGPVCARPRARLWDAADPHGRRLQRPPRRRSADAVHARVPA